MKSLLLLLPLLAPSAAATACYSSPGQLVPSLHAAFQSRSLCQHHCSKTNHSIAALHNGTACFCGSPADLPPDTAKRPLSDCQTPCPGYPTDTCGGPTAWTILTPGLRRRIDPAAESVIVTAPDTHPDEAHPDPLASLSVNPTVVQTGVPLPTGSAGAIDGYKTAPIPNSILTAPEEPEPSTAKTQAVATSMGTSVAAAPPTSTMTTTVSSAVVQSGAATGSVGATSGAASPSASPSGAAAGLVVPGGGFVGGLAVVVALLY
ncbi:WSC-domain-containing protein [Aspergillus terreus]|uniref:WSC-domain-containing protein n=1 Tax=Aspergillus terreus TaxID=33178 RepID=A0A5M3ZDC7_ASPTE|nr:hypothetical protein ATETN484_0012022700 [Aspergillus terreus]GFF19475.1 WSC-domain-containing protein [Aspergillus terreus]